MQIQSDNVIREGLLTFNSNSIHYRGLFNLSSLKCMLTIDLLNQNTIQFSYFNRDIYIFIS